MEYLWPCSIQCHFVVIRCTCNFFRKYDFQKTLLLRQVTAKIYQTSPEVSSYSSSQNHAWDVWNFEFPAFNDFLKIKLNSPLYPVEKPKASIMWKRSDRRGRKVMKFGTRRHVWGAFWPCSIQGHFGRIRRTFDFSWLSLNDKEIEKKKQHCEWL